MSERQVTIILKALEYALENMKLSNIDYMALDEAISNTMDILRYYDEL